MTAIATEPLDAYQRAARMLRGECEEWQGSRDKCGYGRVGRGGKNRLAHRVAYEDQVGPIPEGLTLDHLCRNRACVNVDHLEPVTLAENIRRGQGVGTKNRGKTHCPKGHKYTHENTYLNRGRRSCRECGRVATKAWRDRVAGAE